MSYRIIVKEGVMKKLKSLTLEHKKYLVSQGLNPKDFLIEGTTADDYVFYNIHTKMLWELRR